MSVGTFLLVMAGMAAAMVVIFYLGKLWDKAVFGMMGKAIEFLRKN